MSVYTQRFKKMPMYKRKQYKAKTIAKVDEALYLAKKNKRTLSRVAEMDGAFQSVASIAMNATPVVKNIAHSFATTMGNKWKLFSLRVTGTIKQNLASALIDDYRFDVVLDRMPAGVAITPLLVYGAATPKWEAYKDLEVK